MLSKWSQLNVEQTLESSWLDDIDKCSPDLWYVSVYRQLTEHGDESWNSVKVAYPAQ
jgi:hypothetical protein